MFVEEKEAKILAESAPPNADANLGGRVGCWLRADLSQPPEHVDPDSGGAAGARSRAARKLRQRRR